MLVVTFRFREPIEELFWFVRIQDPELTQRRKFEYEYLRRLHYKLIYTKNKNYITRGVVIRSHTKPPLDLIITRLRVIFKIV